MGKVFLQHWSRRVKSVKQSGRKKQAVHDSLTRFLVGEIRGILKETFSNWAFLMRSEKQMQLEEAKSAEEHSKWRKFLAQSQAKYEAALQDKADIASAMRARTHQAINLTFQKWMRGDRKGLLAMTLKCFKQALKEARNHQT